MTHEVLAEGNFIETEIQEAKAFRRQLDLNNSGALTYGTATYPLARGSDLYTLLAEFFDNKIAALEEKFATFDAAPVNVDASADALAEERADGVRTPD